MDRCVDTGSLAPPALPTPVCGPDPHLGVSQQGGLGIGVHGSGGPWLGSRRGCTRRELLRVGQREAGRQWQNKAVPEDGGLGRLREAGGQAGGTGRGTGMSAGLASVPSRPLSPSRRSAPPRPHYLLGLKAPWLLTQRTRGSTNSKLNVSMGTRVILCCGQRARRGRGCAGVACPHWCPTRVLLWTPSPCLAPPAPPLAAQPQPLSAVSGAWAPPSGPQGRFSPPATPLPPAG